MRLILISLLIHVATSTCPIPVDETQASTRDDELTFRLPRNVRPNRYHITLHPDLSPNLDPATFTGSVRIEFTALENTRNITLKIRTLNIDHDSVQVTDSNNNSLTILNSEEIESVEFFVVHLQNDLVEGNNYVVSIERYSGILNLQSAGLYLGKYWDEDGTERRMATTQFESTNARRAFPSFDEPEWKATYITKLRRTADFISISNEDIVDTQQIQVGGDTFFEDTYKETVKMSTYLNAFIVTQFTYVEEGNQKVYSRPEYINAGWLDFALQTGIDTIKALDEFTEIPYSSTVAKLDQIGIPDDYFSPGAMENWGLVTYRESYLLYHESITTDTQLQRMVTVIAHEYAHQWFGNLVTMSWWKYLWLNEGFATYFEFYAASVVQPTWRLMEQLALEAQYAFESDSLQATQPMNYETESGGSTPSYIAYEKAGSIIRMAENFLTTEVFRKGLNIYLTNRALDVAEPEDLFSAWQEALVAANKQNLLPPDYDVNAILAPWADQKGYPIVTLTRNYITNQISVSQVRFLLKDIPAEDISVTWPVPLNIFYYTPDNSDFSDTTADFWLLTHAATIQPDGDYDFIIANKKQTGYYRVNYDADNWAAIIQMLRTDDITKINPNNRAQLLDDAFNLARAGVLPYTLPFSLSMYLERETDYIPLTSFFNALRYLHPILASREGYDEFRTFVTTLITPVADSLTFEERPNDGHVDKLNRVNVMNWLCDLGHSECRQLALIKFRQWRASPINNPLTPNSQLYIYCGALRVGDQSDWDFLFETYQNERLDALRTRILGTLGCSGNEAILNRLMTMTLDPGVEFYKAADRQTAFASVYNSGSFGLRVAFNFVANNRAAISASTLNLNTIITGLSTKFSSEDQLADLSAFLTQLGDIVPEATRNTARRNTEDNVNFAKAIMPSIVQFLEENITPTDGTTSGDITTTSVITPTAVETTTDAETTTQDRSTIATTSLALLFLGHLLLSFLK